MPNSESAGRMAAAAGAFLRLLPEVSPARFGFPAEDDRRDWHYVPRLRPGLAFRLMDRAQEKAALELVATGLSVAGFAAVTTVMGLEDVLDELEEHARHRHRADYSVSVFGEPGADTWGWRFEGHHVSLHVTVVDGKVAPTPRFLGANRAEILAPSGTVVTRPLAGEEDLALALVEALSAPARQRAFLGPDAPDDILTTNAPRLDGSIDPEGAALADLGPAAAAAERLVRHYLGHLPDAEAERRWRTLQPGLGDLRFAFAGEPAHRRPLYYRIAGPSLLIEYDNTQDDANHVHTVVRDPAGDFGEDLLRSHRAAHHDTRASSFSGGGRRRPRR